ncbi:sensor histidine kinase [Olivibacter sp. XZL3]|uniref:sensor histidine kinase n=1 Tax=Olivibacter sp. XZL3 TaxID=1735116 RepID=UPI00106639C9|nr:histidine kinase [Olivibacter sp. XZL3]
MKIDLPVRNVIKQSLLFTGMVSTLVMLSAIMEGVPTWQVLDKSISSFFAIFLVCLLNIFLHLGAKPEDPLKSPLWIKVLSFVLSILVVYIVKAIHDSLLNDDLFDKIQLAGLHGGLRYVYLALQACMLNLVVLLWLYFAMAQHAKVQHELESSRLAKARTDAANQLLRQQIHPHFLFNALSTLKALIRKDSATAEVYLLRLSDFLRVSVTAHQQGLSTLKHEVKLCEDYLEMQKIRFKGALSYQIDLSSELLERGVLPLFSLQPLAENAIKHNGFTKEMPLLIHIFQEDDFIVVKNNRIERNYVVESTGSGLSNLAERYRMISEDEIKIEQYPDAFFVKIKILANEYLVDRR